MHPILIDILKHLVCIRCSWYFSAWAHLEELFYHCGFECSTYLPSTVKPNKWLFHLSEISFILVFHSICPCGHRTVSCQAILQTTYRSYNTTINTISRFIAPVDIFPVFRKKTISCFKCRLNIFYCQPNPLSVFVWQ